jgi:hypothetical protein
MNITADAVYFTLQIVKAGQDRRRCGESQIILHVHLRPSIDFKYLNTP